MFNFDKIRVKKIQDDTNCIEERCPERCIERRIE